MNLAAIIPKSQFSRLNISFLPISPSNLRWVSNSLSKTPRLPEDPKSQLVKLFNSMRNPYPNQAVEHEFALVSALKSCSSLKAILQGQQIHCLVLKTGLDSNTFIENSMVHMYAKCDRIGDAKLVFGSSSRLDLVACHIMIIGYVKSGHLDAARKLFDIMPERTCVAYTTIIKGLTQKYRWADAFYVFQDMRLAALIPNEVTMADVILSYMHLGGIREGKVLHALTAKFGLDVFVLVSTNLLHMYCTCSSLADGKRLFDEMCDKNIVSWNVMLNGYAKANLVPLARNLFERIPEKDVVSWGTMIDTYAQLGRLSEALLFYRDMLRTGLRPNDVLVVNLISACGQLMSFEGQQLHASVVNAGLDCLDFVQSTIIHFYASCNKIDLAWLQFESSNKDHLTSWNALMAGFVRNGMIAPAKKIFDDMPGRDVFSWSSMISGYSQTGQPAMALELFHGMIAANVRPNAITMVSVVSAIASVGTLEEGIWVHEYIRCNSIALNDNLSAALVDMYAKCGAIGTALEFFSQIRDRTTSISPWNAIICGLAAHGHAILSLKIFMDLQGIPIKPNSITFIGVLTACCHAGLVEVGKEYFQKMKSMYMIDPNVKHYGCMVDLLGRAGRIREAEEMIRSMPMKADVVIWGTLLAACRKHGNVEVGERAAHSLASLDASHGAGQLLLSNLYADAERWEDALGVRSAMQGRTMTRLPGSSGVV